jgi:hypothetical protein
MSPPGLHQKIEPFQLMALPAELQTMIFEHALPRGGHMVKRNDLRHLPSIRYRCDAQPKFLQESCGADYVTYCNDYDCRDRSRAGLMKHEHILEPSRAQNFAFGLFLTSKTVSDEAIKIFFGQTHFIFESRFDLCMFLSAVGEQAKHVKSVTFNWRKSRGHHSNEVEASHTTWKLQSADCRGPTELTSLQELAEHCPHLEYVEIVGDLGIRPKIALQSGSHLDCPYVQILCNMRLQGFSYLFPSTTCRGAISFAGRLLFRATNRHDYDIVGPCL